MNPQMAGMYLGLFGAALGVLGGVIGCYFSIKNTRGPRERAFMIKCCVACWILVLALLAGMLLIPGWYKHLIWVVYVPVLVFGILWSNRQQARLREEEAPPTM